MRLLLDDRGEMNAILYTRRGCCLCDEARDVLERHGVAVEAIDVDADEALRRQFNDCVPVVEVDGKIRFRGRIDPVLLRRLLAGRRSAD